MDELKLDDFLILSEDGEHELPADVRGPLVATVCQECGHPLLLDNRDGQPGCDGEIATPAACRECGAEYIMSLRTGSRKLYVLSMDSVREAEEDMRQWKKANNLSKPLS